MQDRRQDDIDADIALFENVSLARARFFDDIVSNRNRGASVGARELRHDTVYQLAEFYYLLDVFDIAGLAEPALALSAPEIAGGTEDGLLTMGEIMRLRLDADWVVLSACNTAAGRTSRAEAVSGLGRAFFFAGSRALLVSNWRVDSASARILATDLFTRYAADPTLGKAEALRRAMIGLIDGPGFADGSGKTAFSYAHPIFWAPFSVVGDGGIRR